STQPEDCVNTVNVSDCVAPLRQWAVTLYMCETPPSSCGCVPMGFAVSHIPCFAMAWRCAFACCSITLNGSCAWTLGHSWCQPRAPSSVTIDCINRSAGDADSLEVDAPGATCANT